MKFINFIKEFLLFIWQLPQIIFGAIVFLVACMIGQKVEKRDELNYLFGSKRIGGKEARVKYFCIMKNIGFGVSLSKYFILISKDYIHRIEQTVNHEHGHSIQSLILGPLYLIIVGLPSLLGNIYDRVFHKKWAVEKRMVWYYNQPVEKWADKLGNVKR